MELLILLLFLVGFALFYDCWQTNKEKGFLAIPWWKLLLTFIFILFLLITIF